MFDHLSLGVSDINRATRFYDQVLGSLGYKRVMEFEGQAVAYGPDPERPMFWLGKPEDGSAAAAGKGVHICFAAPSRVAVETFHRTGLAAGGQDNGAPGLRPYTPTYYAAFLIDPDGNKIEAVCHAE